MLVIKKKLEAAIEDLKKISGQRPIITKTKKAIANFKTKKDMPIGCKVTLRKKRMYEFVDRLINIALPRTKDFSGLSEKILMGLEIILLVSKNILFSLKLIMIK